MNSILTRTEFVGAVSMLRQNKSPFESWIYFKSNCLFTVFAKLFFAQSFFLGRQMPDLWTGCPNLGHTTLKTFKIYILYILLGKFCYAAVHCLEMEHWQVRYIAWGDKYAMTPPPPPSKAGAIYFYYFNL